MRINERKDGDGGMRDKERRDEKMSRKRKRGARGGDRARGRAWRKEEKT